MYRLAGAVAHHLDFDVARFCQILLDVNRVVAEGRAGFRARGRERYRKIVRVSRHLHASAATTGGGLDDDRKADLGCDAVRLTVFGDCALRTRHDRNTKPLRRALGLDLVAHDADVLGRWADEGDVVGGQYIGKLGILGQEAVAGMNRVGAGDFASGDDLVDVEIGVPRRRRADADAFVREPDMHRIGVGSRMHRHRADAELLGGAQHTQRDFASVGNQDLVEHASRFPNLIDDDERLAVFDRLGILEQDRRHGAGTRGGDLVHRLHRFDDEQRLAFAHCLADLDERLGFR